MKQLRYHLGNSRYHEIFYETILILKKMTQYYLTIPLNQLSNDMIPIHSTTESVTIQFHVDLSVDDITRSSMFQYTISILKKMTQYYLTIQKLMILLFLFL